MNKPHLQHTGNLKIPSENNLEALISKDWLTAKGSMHEFSIIIRKSTEKSLLSTQKEI